MPLSNKALASGEARADWASARSRVPESMTVCPGRNLRVAGFGVCSVRISMGVMWSRDALQSRTKRRRAGDDPAGDADPDGEADQRSPPLAGAHRLRVGRKLGAAGDHRQRQLLAAKTVINDCEQVQRDQREDHVEP